MYESRLQAGRYKKREIIADLATDRAPAFDLSLFRFSRFAH